MLTDLANLQPSAKAIVRLQQKYPKFVPESPTQLHISIRYVQAESGEALPLDVPENLHHVLWLKEMVCRLWKGNPDSRCLEDLEQVLLSGKIGIGSTIPFVKSLNPLPVSGIIAVDWKRREFVYRPQTLLQEALHYFMQASSKAKVCANPDCPAPYFIAPRTNTRYCSGDCLQSVQREAKRAWWDEKGQAWRRSRKKKIRR